MNGRPDELPDLAGAPDHDVLLDERGQRCPLPVIALARVAKEAPEARVLLLSDDPAAATDIPAWCSLRGRALEWTADTGDALAFLVVPLGS